MQRPPAPDLAARLFGSSPERTLTLMRAAWPVAVGPELARRTDVVSLDAGVLRIRVPDATWQRGLARMRGDIMRRLREIAGAAAPRSLGFVLGSVPASPARDAPPALRTQEAATHASAPAKPVPAQVLAAARSIPDPQLRERFVATAARYLERFSPDSERKGEGTDR
jgi:hypothetical protein